MLVFPLILAFVGCMFCTFCWSKINRRCNELHVKNANTCNFFDWFSYLWEMCEEAGLKPLLLPQIEVEPNLLKLNYLISKKRSLFNGRPNVWRMCFYLISINFASRCHVFKWCKDMCLITFFSYTCWNVSLFLTLYP